MSIPSMGGQQVPAAPPPADTKGDNGTGRTYTQAEVDELFRGQGKALKSAQERVAALEGEAAARKTADEDAEKKRLAERGEFKALAERVTIERDEARMERDAMKQQETRRLARIKDANKDRLGKLPEQLQALLPDGLDPDAAAEQIGKLEALVGSTSIPVHGGAPRGGAPPTPEAKHEAMLKRGHDYIFGDDKKKGGAK